MNKPYDTYGDALDTLCEKVEGVSDESCEELVDDLDLNCHPDSLRKSFNVGRFCGYQVMQYYRNLIAAGITSDDEMKRLEQLKFDIVKERKKREAINREYNSHVRIEGKNELFQELMLDEIKQLKSIEIKNIEYSTPLESVGVLFISDAHYGKEFRLEGLFNEVVNKYNPTIFQERMWNLLAKLEDDFTRFDYDKLKIIDMGDCIDGILRMGSLQKLDTGVIQSTIEYAEFMSHWICEVYNRLHIPIEYSLSGGNHDMIRLLTEKKIFEDENIAKIVQQFISLRVENAKTFAELHNNEIPNIEILQYGDTIYHNIFGMNILSYHGDSKDLQKDIEFFENFYQIQVDMIVAGHLHRNSQETIGYGYMGDREIIRVPSIMGTDDFAKRIRKLSRAGARFMLFNKDGKDLDKTYFLN